MGYHLWVCLFLFHGIRASRYSILIKWSLFIFSRCIHILQGHQSTVRCLKVTHGRPLAVSGSRDATVRIWDILSGKIVHVLEGHDFSIHCLDVCGNKIVSGSYDASCRVWDIETGECLHVLRGHRKQAYCIAFDGVRIASGGVDTTVRIWDPDTGSVRNEVIILPHRLTSLPTNRTCLALLQGHTTLVCQLQLVGNSLITGGSDGQVISFSLSPTYSLVQRLAAHEGSITTLHAGDRFLVTGSSYGTARLFRFNRHTGLCEYVRELTEPSDVVWKIAFSWETCVVLCRRQGRLVIEIWSFTSSR